MKYIFIILILFISPHIVQADITTGLVGHWTFDEGSGTTANDSAGTNDGILTNGPTWTTGQIGGALSFDGVDDYVLVPGGQELSDLTGWTVSFILNYKGTGSGSFNHPISLKGGYGDEGFDLYIAKSKSSISLWARDSDSTQIKRNTYSSVPTNEWITITTTFDTNHNYAVYHNNVLKLSGTNADFNVISAGDWYFGCETGPTDCLGSVIDDIRIYSRALTQADITELYNVGSGATSIPPPTPEPDTENPSIPSTPSNPPTTTTPSSPSSWQDTLDQNFNFTETFDLITDWRGVGSGNTYFQGPNNTWDYFSEWDSNPDISANWIANHGASNIWQGTGKSLRMDLSQGISGGGTPNIGPSRFGTYFGDGTADSGYSSVHVFYMVKYPSNYFPRKTDGTYEYFSYYKFHVLATGFLSINNPITGTNPYGPGINGHPNLKMCSAYCGDNAINSISIKQNYFGGQNGGESYWTNDGSLNSYLSNNEWFGVEFYYNLGTPGQTDGQMKIWFYDNLGNSKQVLDVTQNMMPEGLNYKFNKFFFGGNRSWKDSDYPNLDPVYFIDDFIINDTRIGPTYFALLAGNPPPPPTPPTLQADLNSDNTVNSLDWSIMNNAWGTSDPTADINNDGTVNTIDWSVMNSEWGS